MGGKITQRVIPMWMRVAFTEITGVILWVEGNSPTQDIPGVVVSDSEPAKEPWNTRAAPGTASSGGASVQHSFPQGQRAAQGICSGTSGLGCAVPAVVTRVSLPLLPWGCVLPELPSVPCNQQWLA